eukprot:3797688-Alexandrium_andersonii.AAC.1
MLAAVAFDGAAPPLHQVRRAPLRLHLLCIITGDIPVQGFAHLPRLAAFGGRPRTPRPQPEAEAGQTAAARAR